MVNKKGTVSKDVKKGKKEVIEELIIISRSIEKFNKAKNLCNLTKDSVYFNDKKELSTFKEHLKDIASRLQYLYGKTGRIMYLSKFVKQKIKDSTSSKMYDDEKEIIQYGEEILRNVDKLRVMVERTKMNPSWEELISEKSINNPNSLELANEMNTIKSELNQIKKTIKRLYELEKEVEKLTQSNLGKAKGVLRNFWDHLTMS